MNTDAFLSLAPLICDCHVHIGRFNDGYYFSPQSVYQYLEKLGIKRWVVSSTSTSDNKFEIVTNEIRCLLEKAPGQTIPLLWVTPRMLEVSKNLKAYDTFPVYGIKIHGFSDKWDLDGGLLKKLFNLAMDRGLPVLIHTGYTPESEALVYYRICKQFDKLTIILAHGRPVSQAIQIMKNCKNVLVDTAFMPVGDIRRIANEVGNGRILFGTDFPIDAYYYPKQSIIDRYKRRVNMLVKKFGRDAFLKWAHENFQKVFPPFQMTDKARLKTKLSQIDQ